jgi:hypothetical protein
MRDGAVRLAAAAEVMGLSEGVETGLLVPENGIISISPEDSGPLIAAGWAEVGAEVAGGS